MDKKDKILHQCESDTAQSTLMRRAMEKLHLKDQGVYKIPCGMVTGYMWIRQTTGLMRASGNTGL